MKLLLFPSSCCSVHRVRNIPPGGPIDHKPGRGKPWKAWKHLILFWKKESKLMQRKLDEKPEMKRGSTLLVGCGGY
jgi:hypothetical protein